MQKKKTFSFFEVKSFRVFSFQKVQLQISSAHYRVLQYFFRSIHRLVWQELPFRPLNFCTWLTWLWRKSQDETYDRGENETADSAKCDGINNGRKMMIGKILALQNRVFVFLGKMWLLCKRLKRFIDPRREFWKRWWKGKWHHGNFGKRAYHSLLNREHEFQQSSCSHRKASSRLLHKGVNACKQCDGSTFKVAF